MISGDRGVSKTVPKPKIDPTTDLTDPLVNAPKPNKSMKKAWDDFYKQKADEKQTTQQALIKLLQHDLYKKKNPAYLDHVQKQFKHAYPGQIEYDETGKMVQLKAVIGPEDIQNFQTAMSAYEWDQKNPERIWVKEEKNQKAPARKRAILEGGEADFDIRNNPQTDGEEPFYEIDHFEEVSKYDDTIEQKAKESGIKPDELRAIIYMESTHGYYDKPLEWLDMNKSLRPMNVYASYWKYLGYSRDDLKDPAKNIEAGAKILKRLKENMPNASIREISTLYNNLNAEQVNDYGA